MAQEIHASDAGFSFIANNEGFREKPYQDSGGVWTIGYGYTFPASELADFKNGITRDHAMALLKEHVAYDAVCLGRILGRPLLQHQIDAMLDLIYNVGFKAFSDSMLFGKIQKADPDVNTLWKNFYIHDAKGHQLLGLIKRRRAESVLFIYGDYKHGQEA